MKLVRWIFAIAVLSIWAALIGTGLYVAMYTPAADVPKAEAIVVLSGDAADNGGLSPEMQTRLDKAVELFNEGKGERLVLSGGTGSVQEPVAEAMKTAAIAAGVPEDAITVETASMSTLQNAMFLSDMSEIEKSAPTILVSHRYHLPRANATLRWAGFGDLINVAADGGDTFELSANMLWESLMWPYDILRVAATSAAQAGDVPRESYIAYLE